MGQLDKNQVSMHVCSHSNNVKQEDMLETR